MSFPDGSSFYSTPKPSSDGGVELPDMTPQSQTAEPKVTVENPPYPKRVDQGGESFAPASDTSDQEFQPAHLAPAPEINWPLVALLGLAAIWWVGREQ